MNVERVRWDVFYERFRRRVKAGEHGVMIGSTGSGKSELAKRIVPLFGRNVVVLDAKGGDDPGVDIPGFTLLRKWPPDQERDVRRLWPGDDHEPIRVRLAPKIGKVDELPKARLAFSKALDDLYSRRGRRVFSVYIDELGVFGDRRKFNLGPKVELLLQQMRYRGGSIVTGMQYPTWLPKAAYRETTHRWFFRVADEDSRKYLSSITGDRKAIEETMATLPRFHFVYQDVHADTFLVSKVDL